MDDRYEKLEIVAKNPLIANLYTIFESDRKKGYRYRITTLKTSGKVFAEIRYKTRADYEKDVLFEYEDLFESLGISA